MALDPKPLLNGMVIPRVQYAAASRLVATSCWNEIHRIFDSFNAFVEQCMSEYDLDRWTADPWANVPWTHTDPGKQ